MVDPMSLAGLCVAILKSAGSIFVEFREIKGKIRGAARSFEQLVQYVAMIETAIQELLRRINLSQVSCSGETTKTIRGTLEVCDGELVLVAKYLSRIKPRSQGAGLGFRGTFWSLWNADAVNASRDVLKEHVQSLHFLLQILNLGPGPQQDQAMRNASNRGQVVADGGGSQASRRLRDFVASIEAYSGETVQHSAELLRRRSEEEKSDYELRELIKERRNKQLEADRAHSRNRAAVEAAHRRTMEERRRAQDLGSPADLPRSRRFERLFRTPSDSSGTESPGGGASAPTSPSPAAASPNTPPRTTPSRLMFACAMGNIPEAMALLGSGHDVNEGNDNMTALHIAAASGNSDLARELLRCGAQVAARDAYGQTALHVAAFANAHAVVQLLIQEGADIECEKLEPCEASVNVLESAAEGGEIAVGWRPLHCAADQGYTGVAEILLGANAQVMARTYDGSTALHLACAKAHLAMVQQLLHYGAAPDAMTPERIRPCDVAGSAEVIQCLVYAGATPR